MTRLVEQLLDAFVPTSCVRCSTTGPLICENCQLVAQPQHAGVTRQNLTGRRAYVFEPPIDSAIIAFKDQGQTSLAKFLVGEVALVLSEYLEELGQPDLVLAPVPTSNRGYSKRGYDPNLILARRLSSAANLPLATDLLSLKSQPTDQRELGARERANNLRFSMRGWGQPRTVLLFDDVVTTGATIVEASRALTHAGHKVVGFLTIAETIKK